MFDSLTATQGLAALIGLYFVSAGIGLLRDRSSALQMFDAIKTQPGLGYLAGVIAFVIGGAMVAIHNDWNTVLAGVVSLIGWIALIEGILMLSMRERFIGFFETFVVSDSFLKVMSVATVVAGVLLLWCGLT